MVKNKATFKDMLNLLAGHLFVSGVDHFAQSIQLAIIMIGSNPFSG